MAKSSLVMRCFKVNRAIQGWKSKHVDINNDFNEMLCCGSVHVWGLYMWNESHRKN